ncbi:MAG: Gfo/Idh/MocA family oxidoreductase [Rhodobacteraceae bacterium]|jgi:predicted dehydrogenase|nr:Gfo/Idh/MocA family oxidoreductase [Paracoccaceae bacterium]
MTDKLNIGVLGCGPIAQAGHFESCTKARNARLYAVCDVAADLRDRMAVAHGAERAFGDYDEMLADPAVQAVIVATSDAFHVEASIRALRAGKHVLCEKPVAMGLPETERLAEVVRETGLTFQIGHMKRYDIGLQEAKRFVDDGMGEMVALKAWYCDSTHRYAMTDAVQPLIVRSAQARRPAEDPKADLRRYYMLAHGSHLVDTARYFAGPLVSVNARLSDRRGMHCWFVDVEFENGALGHLDLTVAVRMDWHEGFTIYGARGSVTARTYNPWYFRSSDVEIFHEADATTRRPLGADGHFYRRQVEGFADTVLTGAPMTGAGIEDGLASVRAMLAIARSVDEGRPVRLADAGGVL